MGPVGTPKSVQGLSHLLIKLSQFDNAQKLFKTMLDQTEDQHEKASIYHELGVIHNGQKKLW